MNGLPRIIGHRGNPAHYPENSLAGLRAAAAAGADGVELDVQMTTDGVPVVFHDSDLQRTTGCGGLILDFSWPELRGVSVGEAKRFGSRFASETLPLLADAAAMLAGYPDSRVFVEIKWECAQQRSVPEVTRAVLEACRPLGDALVIISFDERFLREARSLAPVPVGWAISDWNPAQESLARTLAPDYLFCSRRRLPVAEQALWPGPWEWIVYEVNDPNEARTLAQRGVWGIETANVDAMVSGLGR